MNLLAFEFKVAISTRPGESIGTDEAWELATNALIGAVSKAGLPYEINEGATAPFTGQRLMCAFWTALAVNGNAPQFRWDFTLPERFDSGLYRQRWPGTQAGNGTQGHHGVSIERALSAS